MAIDPMKEIDLRSNLLEEADSWNNGCIEDPVRNEFIIPIIANLLEKDMPRTILDIGTGTGYIPRILESQISYHPEWTLIDVNSERIAFAERHKTATMQMACLVGALSDLETTCRTFDSVLLTFTLLEAENPTAMMESAINLLADKGLLVIAVPDGWRDVLTATGGDRKLCHQFLTETVELPKIDKFTRSPYPFFTMRIESLISAGLRSLCVLEALERGGPQGEVYMLVFRKRRTTAPAAINA